MMQIALGIQICLRGKSVSCELSMMYLHFWLSYCAPLRVSSRNRSSLSFSCSRSGVTMGWPSES